MDKLLDKTEKGLKKKGEEKENDETITSEEISINTKNPKIYTIMNKSIFLICFVLLADTLM